MLRFAASQSVGLAVLSLPLESSLRVDVRIYNTASPEGGFSDSRVMRRGTTLARMFRGTPCSPPLSSFSGIFSAFCDEQTNVRKASSPGSLSSESEGSVDLSGTQAGMAQQRSGVLRTAPRSRGGTTANSSYLVSLRAGLSGSKLRITYGSYNSQTSRLPSSFQLHCVLRIQIRKHHDDHRAASGCRQHHRRSRAYNTMACYSRHCSCGLVDPLLMAPTRLQIPHNQRPKGELDILPGQESIPQELPTFAERRCS